VQRIGAHFTSDARRARHLLEALIRYPRAALPGRIVEVRDTYINLGSRDVRGVDVELQGRWGAVKLNALAATSRASPTAFRPSPTPRIWPGSTVIRAGAPASAQAGSARPGPSA
jgi:hypothetical protein